MYTYILWYVCGMLILYLLVRYHYMLCIPLPYVIPYYYVRIRCVSYVQRATKDLFSVIWYKYCAITKTTKTAKITDLTFFKCCK